MNQLVYLSPVPWHSYAQRPHRFAEWFHQRTGGNVLWVDPYPTRFPSLGDLRRLHPRARQPRSTRPGWLHLLCPRAFPIEPLPGSGFINRVLWARLVERLRACSRGADTLLVAGKPSLLALHLLPQLQVRATVYDAMDDFPAFYAGMSRWAMERREDRLAHRVDMVLASSLALVERWRKVCLDVRWVPNGVDPAAVSRPRLRGSRADGHLLGYVGTMGHWFDWAWVSTLAHARPGDRLHLIGPVHAPPPAGLPANVEVLSPVAHDAAMEAMRGFDVGLIPHKPGRLTESVDPIKYYEYRALGLPVLSTPCGDMRARAHDPGVWLAGVDDDLGAMVAEALSYCPLEEERERFVREHAWEARFDAAALLA